MNVNIKMSGYERQLAHQLQWDVMTKDEADQAIISVRMFLFDNAYQMFDPQGYQRTDGIEPNEYLDVRQFARAIYNEEMEEFLQANGYSPQIEEPEEELDEYAFEERDMYDPDDVVSEL